jgi:hypothetical protein
MRSTRNVSITMPTAMVKEAERLAKHEKRTMSELLREAFRQYKERRGHGREDDLQMVMQIVNEVIKRPMTSEELRAENKKLMEYGAQQAKKAGSKERDIPASSMNPAPAAALVRADPDTTHLHCGLRASDRRHGGTL